MLYHKTISIWKEISDAVVIERKAWGRHPVSNMYMWHERLRDVIRFRSSRRRFLRFRAGDPDRVRHFPAPPPRHRRCRRRRQQWSRLKKTSQHAMTKHSISSRTPLPVHHPGNGAGPSNVRQIKFERRAYPGKWTRCKSFLHSNPVLFTTHSSIRVFTSCSSERFVYGIIRRLRKKNQELMIYSRSPGAVQNHISLDRFTFRRSQQRRLRVLSVRLDLSRWPRFRRPKTGSDREGWRRLGIGRGRRGWRRRGPTGHAWAWE